jgi:hypothetical protein
MERHAVISGNLLPVELRPEKAAFELRLDDRSKLVFIPLRGGGLSIQSWRPGQARDGHGFLLSGSALLSEQEVATLIASLGKEN